MGIIEETVGIANRWLNQLIEHNAPEMERYTEESWADISFTFDTYYYQPAKRKPFVFNDCRIIIATLYDGEDSSEMMMLVDEDSRVQDAYWAHDGEVMTIDRDLFKDVTL